MNLERKTNKHNQESKFLSGIGKFLVSEENTPLSLKVRAGAGILAYKVYGLLGDFPPAAYAVGIVASIGEPELKFLDAIKESR